MTIIQAIILAFVEGVTEYLPISSTGHMILVSHFMGIAENHFVQHYEIIIQFGAILSVLFLYRQKFLNAFWLYPKVAMAFLPTAVIGFVLKTRIESLLGSSTIVAWSLLIGGGVLYWSDLHFKNRESKTELQNLSLVSCALLGTIQCLALIPGVSRSGASIIGGLFLGLNKKDAAEFSFFLAVPTLAAASFYKMYKLFKTGGGPNSDEVELLIIGLTIAFVTATLAIKAFIAFVQNNAFKVFAVYRIILGAFILWFLE